MKLLHQTAELANHSQAWEQAHKDIKRTNTSVAPLQKKKKPNSRQKLWLIESIQKPSHLLFLHEKNSNMLPERCCIQVMWVRFNGCVTRLYLKIFFAQNTDLVTFDASCQHRPKTQKSFVRQHYGHHVLSITNKCIISKLKISISWPFFPFFDTLSSHGTWMQHVMLCFLTPSYEILLYRTLLHPWVHSQSPQTFSSALRAYLALGQWLQDEMWQPSHCARCFVVIHCSILGV